jgi:MSHA biogenesis protein MshO
MNPWCRHVGFSLVEAVVVIAVLGIISAGLAFFMRTPVLSYIDAESRARLSDNAETALRRIGRELQSALPNSVRVTSAGGVFYLEFLQTRTGGRYRAAPDISILPQVPTSVNTCPDTNANGFADEDTMAFGVADTCFRTIGAVPISPTSGPVVPGSDFLVIYNLGPGFANADAYASGAVTGGNKSLIATFAASAGNENRFTFAANNFLLDSPSHRFHVVSGPVTFECNPTTGVVNRYANYAIAAAQPAPPGVAPDLLAQNVSNCTITFAAGNQRTGVVSIWLQLTDASGARVNLFQQMLVNNAP